MRLIRGAPGTGKTRQVFREFKAALLAGETNVRIVVPTATLVRHFQHELARDGVVFSPRSVVSLNRFLMECAGETQLVPGGLLRAIVRDRLQRVPFPEFEAVAGTDGMAATVVDTIDLFENAGCTPDKLASVRKLSPHARAFEKLWRAVAERVRQCGYRLRGDWIRAASHPQPARIWPARIWMDGFLNFSPVEHEFLRTLSQACDVTVTLSTLHATEETYRFALKIGAQDRLLPGSPRAPRSAIVSAPTVEREADEIARRIIELHKQGTDFRDIGVALRDAATYVPLLKGTFERFGIPARFYFSSPLRTHLAARFLGGLVAGALSGWELEPMVDTLRAHPRWGTRADLDRFDFAVRESMPGRGAAALLALCQSEWLREEIAGCLQIESWKTAALKPADWLKRFASLAENLYRPGILAPPSDRIAVEAARSHVAALRSWIGAVESATAFWTNPAQPVSLDEFWVVASVAIDSTLLRPIDNRADVVHVMNVWEARQWDVASLFVAGMTDRDFPRQPPPNLLLRDSDIDVLLRAGVPLRRGSDYENEERWLFESLKTRAAGDLILTYPARDATGKSVQRSRLIDFDAAAESAQLCRAAPRIQPPSLAHAGRVASPALHTAMAALHQSISLTSLEDLAQCRFRFFSRKTLLLQDSPERPEKRLQPRVTGSILHLALERWLTDRTRDFVEVFQTVFEETCRKEHIPPGYRLEVERIAFREIARRVSANDLWTPDSSEVEVPLAIGFPGGITVNCRIDRIDRFGDDCVIIDYKSSKTARVEKLVTSPTALQGPLYALAVRENRNLNPVAMIFWAVREDERYGWGEVPGVNIESLVPVPENWTADAKARTVERLADFLAGNVQPHPADRDQCRWCDYSVACRFEEQTLVQIGGAQLA